MLGVGCRVQGVEGDMLRHVRIPWVWGVGCGVQGAGCRVQGVGGRVKGVGCRMQDVGCRV